MVSVPLPLDRLEVGEEDLVLLLGGPDRLHLRPLPQKPLKPFLDFG